LFYPCRKLIEEAPAKIPEHILLYTDSDHCGEEKKRSTSGWAVLLRGCRVAWGSKLQATANESTCTKLRDLLFKMTSKYVSTELLVDNQSAVGKLDRPAGAPRGNTWLDLKWRVVHQCHMEKLVRIRYIPTAEQVVDILTKVLSPIVHERAVDLLGVYCFKQKSVECATSDERTRLICNGVKVPLIKHTSIHEGAKECSVCKEFYDAFK
jgi:hypothetical protein